MFTVRLATPEDAEALPAIETSAGQAFLALPDFHWVAEGAPISPDRHRALMAHGAIWVAEAKDNGSGLLRQGFLAAEPLGDGLHIWEVSVRREAQGRGIGRALIAAAIAAAADHGLARVTLTTFRHVPWNAPFYAGLGFQLREGDALSPRLRAILAQEVEAGLPADARCAMELTVLGA